MLNFPSKWFEFLNQKELKRLRRDVNNTFWLKTQIVTSIIVAIGTLIFSENIKTLAIQCKILISVGLSLLVIVMFCLPWIIRVVSLLRINNRLIDGKEAATIFDEEVVYNILVASEFYNVYNTSADDKGNLSVELKDFYKIEAEYYIKTAIKKLVLFNGNVVRIIGEQKKQISVKRIKNITQMIDKIISDMKITIESGLMGDYIAFKKNVK